MLSGLTLLVVAVVSYAPHGDVDAARLGEVASAVKRAVRERGDTVLDGAFSEAETAFRAGWRPRARFAFFEKAKSHMDEGRTALEHVELERALLALGRAEQMLEDERALPGVETLLAETLVGKGIALFELGRDKEASAAFERAASLDRDVKLSVARVRPAIAAAYAQAAARAASNENKNEKEKEKENANAHLAALRVAPRVEDIRWLCGMLGIDGVWIASTSARGDGLALVVQRISADGTLGGRGSERAANVADLSRATKVAIDRAMNDGARESIVWVSKAPKMTSAPPPEAPKKKKPVWERPWLWGGILVATTAIVLGVSLGVETPSAVTARVSGGDFGIK